MILFVNISAGYVCGPGASSLLAEETGGFLPGFIGAYWICQRKSLSPWDFNLKGILQLIQFLVMYSRLFNNIYSNLSVR